MIQEVVHAVAETQLLIHQESAAVRRVFEPTRADPLTERCFDFLGGLVCALLAVGGLVLGIWLTSLRRQHEIIDKYEQPTLVERAQRAHEAEEAAQEAG